MFSNSNTPTPNLILAWGHRMMWPHMVHIGAQEGWVGGGRSWPSRVSTWKIECQGSVLKDVSQQKLLWWVELVWGARETGAGQGSDSGRIFRGLRMSVPNLRNSQQGHLHQAHVVHVGVQRQLVLNPAGYEIKYLWLLRWDVPGAKYRHGEVE